MIEKPMLAVAAPEDFNKLRYPLIATPKIDGIRCLKTDHQVVSRKLKPIPNLYTRTYLEDELPEGADGELFAGASFNDTTRAIMSRGGTPEFVYLMFDLVDDPATPYKERLIRMADWHDLYTKNFRAIGRSSIRIFLLPCIDINNPSELEAYERRCLSEGFEGAMVRDPEGPYKFGRSTVREGWLLKIKRFADAEAEVIGFEEAHHNENELEKDALGYAKRSTAKEGKKAAGWLGALIVKDVSTGIEFNIGGGFTQSQRQVIWRARELYSGRIAKYKYQPHGSEDKPRFPQFIGWRDGRDM